MGSYKYYKLPFDQWADRISGDAGTADHWRDVFVEHPEFFRLDSERKKASLIWRRQHPKRYHIDQDRLLTREEFDRLDAEQKLRVSRVALAADDIQALMQAAIDLHSRAIEHQRERRWWIPLLASAVGGLFGAIAGAVIADGIDPKVDPPLAALASSSDGPAAGPGASGANEGSFGNDSSPGKPPAPIESAKRAVRGDFDGDGHLDFAELTEAADEVTVAVHRTGSPVQTLVFAVNPRSSGALCGLPATLEPEPVNCGPDDPLPGCRADNGAVQLTLGGGECDPIYLYWDHEQSRMGWWQP